jgi:hypothetical protein
MAVSAGGQQERHGAVRIGGGHIDHRVAEAVSLPEAEMAGANDGSKRKGNLVVDENAGGQFFGADAEERHVMVVIVVLAVAVGVLGKAPQWLAGGNAKEIPLRPGRAKPKGVIGDADDDLVWCKFSMNIVEAADVGAFGVKMELPLALVVIDADIGVTAGIGYRGGSGGCYHQNSGNCQWYQVVHICTPI